MKRNYFSVLVVGENPEEMLKQYDNHLMVEPYIAIKKDESATLFNNAKIILATLLKCGKLTELQENTIKNELSHLNEINEDEYFAEISHGMKIDDDGNAISTKNPNGKFDYCKIGKRFSLPFILHDGSKVSKCQVKDVDWEKMHQEKTNMHTYEVIWEMFKEGKTPETEEEKTLYANMQTLNNYFDSFKSKEDYVEYNTSFFHYAYLDKNGWKDMDDVISAQEWISDFYYKFITKLNENDVISVYECKIDN